jgi:hypothetical protein
VGILVERELGGAAHGAVAVGPVEDQWVLGVGDAAPSKLFFPRRLVVHRLFGVSAVPALRFVAIPLFDVGVRRWRGRRWRRLGRRGR